MPIDTRIIMLTAARTFVGQHTIELPSFCRDDRFRGIVANGGNTARFLAERMIFGRVHGTGLALPVISPIRNPVTPDFTLAEISTYLRQDGFIF